VISRAIDLPQSEPQRDVPVLPPAIIRWRLHDLVTGRDRFERTVPLRMIDVGGQHHDAMFAGVADDLCRSVETHRLRIEEGAAEGCGEVAFQPARYVDEMREAGRVAFGKAVFAEAADLVEAALREIAIVAAPDHAFDHHVLQFVDHSAAAEGGHRLAQPVRLERGEFRRIERDLHRLFLEDRDP
jgi:hypothetical protein